ncbi:MAG: hypothetical protein GY864_15210 [Desulfobacterales bacterium]|nr:hypothetical protein [Desulfobacterales bacterium]
MINSDTIRDKILFNNLRYILVFMLFFILATASSVKAHKVYIYAWVEGDTVHVESYFSKTRKVNEGLIQVFDTSGTKLLEGRTNKSGEFSFALPKKTDLRIVVGAGTGHRNEYILEGEETPEGSGVAAGPGKTTDETAVSPSPIQADTEHIRIIVEQVIEARLKPISRELAEIRREKGPGLTEIIGGIGYIFGIMGLIMYLKGRRKKR